MTEIVDDMKQVTGTRGYCMQVFEKQQLLKEKTVTSALQRSVGLRSKFVSDCSVYSPEMLVFLNETGCGRRSSLRKFGYSLLGKCAPCTSLLVLGVRVFSDWDSHC